MTKYLGPVIDVDVHHNPKTDADVIAYLPNQWKEFVRGNGRTSFPITPPASGAGGLLNNAARRADAFPLSGGFPGTDYETMRAQLLDKYNFSLALTTFDVGEYASHLNPYFAAAVCSAVNDWNIEQWLTRDKRLLSVVIVPSSDPLLAAAEVRRVGGHSQLVAVLMSGNPAGKPFGDPHYHPIYEAAAELGLAINIHVAASDRPSSIAAVGGLRATGTEAISQHFLAGMHYVSSFIVHGVFEKYPTLRLVMVEYGVAWIPALIWRLDREYDLLRRETPWVRRLPSEYVRDHVLFSTQPLEESPDRKGVAQILETVDGIDDLLCFSTDYPHMSMDDPLFVARLLPESWHHKIFCENACRAYGLKVPNDAVAGLVEAG